MGRRRHHEEHENHERWAIPYGDLVTLLLAFFVVMYSISQVNEGKYRVVADSLNAAFRGEPTTISPVQVGDQAGNAATAVAPSLVELPEQVQARALRQLAADTEQAMQSLIEQGLVDVSSGNGKLTIAIRSDLLFASGQARPSEAATPVIRLLGEVLRDFPVDIKVEGHTDNVQVLPGSAFQSNWELSAGRAASVVRLLIGTGVAPQRLSAIGFGEYRPVAPNNTADGRNANRRVVLQVEGADGSADSSPAVPVPAGEGAPASSAVVPVPATPAGPDAPVAASTANASAAQPL